MSSDLEPQPAPDRSTLLPILLGVFSLFGIIIVLLLGRFNASRNAVPAPETATPFRYLLIGTEPGISTAETATESGGSSIESDSPDLSVTAQSGKLKSSSTPFSGTVPSVTKTKSSSSANPSVTKTVSSVIKTATNSGSSPIIVLNPGTQKPTNTPFPVVFSTHTPTRTPGPTITTTPILLYPRTYDDFYGLFEFNGWEKKAESSAYLGTLHVSYILGSTLAFSFTGQQFWIKYQAGDGLGILQIEIDEINFGLDQAEGSGDSEWESIPLVQGNHTVVITHSGNGAVNIDAIVIE
jgi:hypothetical protein